MVHVFLFVYVPVDDDIASTVVWSWWNKKELLTMALQQNNAKMECL